MMLTQAELMHVFLDDPHVERVYRGSGNWDLVRDGVYLGTLWVS